MERSLSPTNLARYEGVKPQIALSEACEKCHVIQ